MAEAFIEKMLARAAEVSAVDDWAPRSGEPTDHANVCGFARAMTQECEWDGFGASDQLHAMLSLFEKPAQWSREIALWMRTGLTPMQAVGVLDQRDEQAEEATERRESDWRLIYHVCAPGSCGRAAAILSLAERAALSSAAYALRDGEGLGEGHTSWGAIGASTDIAHARMAAAIREGLRAMGRADLIAIFQTR